MNGPRLIFLGDEATGAGLRLAGVETHAVDAEGAQRAYAQHAPRADLLVLGAEVARGLQARRLAHDLAARHPLLLVLPPLRGAAQRDNPATLIRRRLGVRDDTEAGEAM